MRFDDLWRVSEQDWDLTLDVNLKGYFAMIREVTPHMARQGGGAIVSTSSWSGFGHPSNSPYAVAKEGVVGLTRTAARELGRFGIRANAIRPMAITLQVGEYHEETTPWRRLMDLTMGASTNDTDAASATPAMVAPFVVWLCTDAAAGVNGRTFFVSGDDVMLLSEPKAQATITHDGRMGPRRPRRRGPDRARRRAHQPLPPRRPPRHAGVRRGRHRLSLGPPSRRSPGPRRSSGAATGSAPT